MHIFLSRQLQCTSYVYYSENNISFHHAFSWIGLRSISQPDKRREAPPIAANQPSRKEL